ncbi:putative transmembrane protein [Toxoplasma gondii TgCatPRC2]|uniref:Putative transmembrane protein n=1 Tax=Toxoplasma gondii TgCatPRC2 TaxID=1130821 RepID=A0A151HL88_TOXGO|nr:putative transmembrane protein [Toxoplasma gondii TgCatPRC2]
MLAPSNGSQDGTANAALLSSNSFAQSAIYNSRCSPDAHFPPPRGILESVPPPLGLGSPQSPADDAERASQKIWRSYLYGQLANVTKAAVWWSMFGTLMISLVGSDNAVGITRAAFNLALVLVSPLAGAVAERASIRRLLATTTVTRLLIWSVAVPAAWIFFKNDLDRPDLFLLSLVALMFCDGVQVAFANVVDIDCGGLDTLSAQYSLPIDDRLRNRLNGCHQMVFDLSFILFTPPIAFGVYILSQHLSHLLPEAWLPYLGSDPGVFSLVSSMSFIFCVLSAISLGCYLFGLPRKTLFYGESSSDESCYEGSAGGHPGTDRRRSGGGAACPRGNGLLADTVDNYSETSETHTDLSSAHTLSLFQETVSRLEDVRDGFLIVLKEKELGWRLVFLAFETALEDSMVSVVIPELALRCYATTFAMLAAGFGAGPVYHSAPSSPPTGVPVFGEGLANGFSVNGTSSVSAVNSTLAPSSSAVYFPSAEPVSASTFAGLAGLPLAFSLPSFDFLFSTAELPLSGSPNRAYANLWAVAIIAVGKVGGCLAGFYMNRRWVPPASYSRDSAYCRLFWCVLASSLSVALLPLSHFLFLHNLAPGWLCAGLVFLSAFAFFLFSTAPKIGFATLLQGLVSSQQVACKVFGFVGTFVTVTDAVVIACINLIFTAFPATHFFASLLCVSGIYLLHGLVEAFIGPRLILEPPRRRGGPQAPDLAAHGREIVMGSVATPVAGSTGDSSAWAPRPGERSAHGLLSAYQGDAGTGVYWTRDLGADTGGNPYPVAADQQQRGSKRGR